jgi:hypothetical protein
MHLCTHTRTHRQTDKDTDTQTHRHTDTQTHRHTDTNIHIYTGRLPLEIPHPAKNKKSHVAENTSQKCDFARILQNLPVWPLGNMIFFFISGNRAFQLENAIHVHI